MRALLSVLARSFLLGFAPKSPSVGEVLLPMHHSSIYAQQRSSAAMARSKPNPSRPSPTPLKAATRAMYAKVSSHETSQLAEIALQLYDSFGYVAQYNYGSRGRSKVYRCVEHQHCGKFLRVRDYVCEETKLVLYDLEHRGQHSAALSNRKRTGIHPAFKVEVDTAVLAGAGPTKVVLALVKKYEHQPQLLEHVPSRVQVKNRKALLKRQLLSLFD